MALLPQDPATERLKHSLPQLVLLLDKFARRLTRGCRRIQRLAGCEVSRCSHNAFTTLKSKQAIELLNAGGRASRGVEALLALPCHSSEPRCVSQQPRESSPNRCCSPNAARAEHGRHLLATASHSEASLQQESILVLAGRREASGLWQAGCPLTYDQQVSLLPACRHLMTPK